MNKTITTSIKPAYPNIKAYRTELKRISYPEKLSTKEIKECMSYLDLLYEKAYYNDEKVDIRYYMETGKDEIKQRKSVQTKWINAFKWISTLLTTSIL